MGQDEVGTLARLKALRGELIDPRIAQHRGRIVKTTGDGLLVEFQSVVDAVRCALIRSSTGCAPKVGFAVGSLLEERGFEPLVPLACLLAGSQAQARKGNGAPCSAFAPMSSVRCP
jgi:hypothetical protein